MTRKHSPARAVAPAQPRAVGAAHVAVRARDGRTALADLRQSGCLKLVFPTTHRPEAEAVLVNTAGGVTGGDRLALSAEVGADARLTVTTQAAERLYRATAGSQGNIQNTLSVGQGGHLNWLPQETIVFDHAAVSRRLQISLARDATAVMVETLIFGRTAMGERVACVDLWDRIAIDRAGSPIFRDAVRLSGDASRSLRGAATGAGACAVSSIVMVGPQAPALLGQVRALLPVTGGASLLAADVLVVRLLAADGLALRRSLIPILDRLTHQSLPTVWRL
ncbi:urease accessory protein UreD [Sulfitobacter sp. S190]|uniref:urease accessory protein UreD n=1 Tax=Sulfitobacter sp. S190 TaxID=2867022 RepID=UPI0021A4AF1E|nr:urease accessory protein UreD [Sulfitobacter sp. S190]